MTIAQNNLGRAYTTGEGGDRDYAQAPVWFRKAADQGFAAAYGYRSAEEALRALQAPAK